MSAERIPTLVDQLTAAAVEARKVLGELRSEQREARKVLREVAEERERVETMVRRSVEAEITEAVQVEVAALRNATERAMEATAERIARKFDALANIMLRGDRRPGHTEGLDLEAIIAGREGETP